MGFQDYILLNPSPTENLSVEVEVGDLHGNSVEFRLLIPSEFEAKKLVTPLKHSTFKITKVEKTEKKRHPVPPFITSGAGKTETAKVFFEAIEEGDYPDLKKVNFLLLQYR